MITVGPYTDFPALQKALPPLVREQRRLEALIAPVLPLIEPEKDVRKRIDALLLAAGIAKGESVSCLGYDVTHCARAGNETLNPETIVSLLVAAGVERDLVDQVLKDSTETADNAQWATVKPSKGSKVRPPPTDKPRPRARRRG
jgi:hypothetical protein